MTRSKMIKQIKEYFDKKGGPMSLEEYKHAEDAPIKFNLLKARIGSWGRILKMAATEVTISVTVQELVKPEEKIPAVEEKPTPKASLKPKGA